MKENKMKTKRIMSVDRQMDGFYYIVNETDSRGNSKQLARGKVKTRGWIKRKANQLKTGEILMDAWPPRRFNGIAWRKGHQAYKFEIESFRPDSIIRLAVQRTAAKKPREIYIDTQNEPR